MGPLIWLDAFKVKGTFSLLFSEYLACVLKGGGPRTLETNKSWSTGGCLQHRTALLTILLQ